MFIVGLVLLLDAGLPTKTESIQVDRHTSRLENRTTGSGHAGGADTSYTLHFLGGRVSSCSVGYSAYNKLKDGDTVEIRATKLFKTCVRIAQGAEVLQFDKYWKLMRLIGGCLLIAAAIGWIKSEDEGGIRIPRMG